MSEVEGLEPVTERKDPLYKLVIGVFNIKYKRVEKVVIVNYKYGFMELSGIYRQSFKPGGELESIVQEVMRAHNISHYDSNSKGYIFVKEMHYDIDKDLLIAHTIGEARRKKKIVEDLICDIEAKNHYPPLIFE